MIMAMIGGGGGGGDGNFGNYRLFDSPRVYSHPTSFFNMKRILAISMFLALAACSSPSNQDSLGETKAKGIAEKHIESSQEYIDNEGSKLIHLKTMQSNCPDCWLLIFVFDIPSGKGTASITIENGEVLQDQFDFVDTTQIDITSFMNNFAVATDLMPGKFNDVIVSWNTANGTLSFHGKGFGFGAEMQSEEALNFHNKVLDYLKDKGFQTDPQNATSGSPEYDEKRSRKDNIICNVIRRDIPEKAGTDISVNCADENATKIKIKIGEEFMIKLKGNPTTGFLWAAEYDPEYLELIDDSYNQYQAPDLVGAGGVFSFKLKAIKEGVSSLAFTYSRPWESMPPLELREYQVTIIN